MPGAAGGSNRPRSFPDHLGGPPTAMADRRKSEGNAIMSIVRLRALALLLAGSAAPIMAQAPVAGATPAGVVSAVTADAAVGPLQLAPASPAEVKAQCDRRLGAMAALRARIEGMPLESEPMALLRAYDDLYLVGMTATSTDAVILMSAHPDAAIRQAGQDCVQRSGAAMVDISLSRPIYERLLQVEKRGVPAELQPMLARQLANYRRAGVDKDEAARAEVTKLQNRIIADSATFEKNVAEDNRTVTARPDELDGLPQAWLAAHPVGADGLVRIGMTYPEVFPLLSNARNAELRKRVLKAFQTRAYPANAAVLGRVVEDRAKLATLLGYPSFAALDLSSRMAANPERVERFMADIDAVARPVAEAETARMLARLQRDDPGLKQLDAWSTSYARQLVKREDYAVDPAEIRPYFAFDKVQAGIFALTSDLFGVEIRRWKTATWHADVEAFEMVQAGKVIGRFFLDMHPRPGKYTHAQLAFARVGVADRQLPVAVLMTPFTKGQMEHMEVVTFLHEFGHLIHWIFSGAQPFAAQNAAELEGDVVEAPSTLLEEWVWDYETLRRFATNDKGQPIPAELVARVNAGRQFGEASTWTRQLGFANAALTLYSGAQPGRDLSQVYETAYNRYSAVPTVPGTHEYASFGHLIGYGASYYTYVWSKALASDLFGEFRRNGLRDRATALRYRESVLAPGGSASMNVLARNFLGRDWSVDAFRRELQGTE